MSYVCSFSLYWICSIIRQFIIYSLCVSCVICMCFSSVAEFGFFTFTLDAVRRFMLEASNKDIKKGISDSLHEVHVGHEGWLTIPCKYLDVNLLSLFRCNIVQWIFLHLNYVNKPCGFGIHKLC